LSVTEEKIYGDLQCNNSPQELNVCHLYGNLMNTYGDNGNILVLKYLGEKLRIKMNFEIVSLNDKFDCKKYDLLFFGGGQDYEQRVVAHDLPKKREQIQNYIERNGVLLAICGGYQFLGHYYIEASGRRVAGLGVLDHYTLRQNHNRFIGDIEILCEETGEHYYGFENHQGRTFLGEGERALGRVIQGFGNNGEDKTEGLIYKNVYGSYVHGPLLARNPKLAISMLEKSLANKYGKNVTLAPWEELALFQN